MLSRKTNTTPGIRAQPSLHQIMSRTVSPLMTRRPRRWNLRQCLNVHAFSTREEVDQPCEIAGRLKEGRSKKQNQMQILPTSLYRHQKRSSRRLYSSSSSLTSPMPIPAASGSAENLAAKRIVLPSISYSPRPNDGMNPNYKHLDPWDTSDETMIPPIDSDDVRLDRQTRFLLQLLKEKRMHGLRNARFHRKSVAETLTTEKCHFWMQQLAVTNATSASSSNSTTTLSERCWNRAERARLILEHMEAIADDFRQACLRQYQRQHAAGREMFHTHDNQRVYLSSFSRLTESSKTLPLPTSETYLLALKLHATKYLHGDASVPETCRAIVERMQLNVLTTFDDDVNAKEEGEMGDKTSQGTANQKRILSSLSPKPTTQHWNQVIIAWANSMDPKRPIHAAQIAHALDEQGMADASTFSHALRACVSLNSRQQAATPDFIKLALPVANKLQNGLLARQLQSKDDPNHVPLEAFHIVHLLRVARNLIPSQASKPQKEQQEQRNEMIRNTWQMATRHAKINVHVLQELLHVASPDLVHELIQSDEGVGKRSGESTNAEIMKDPLQLIQLLPAEWIDLATPDQDPYRW